MILQGTKLTLSFFNLQIKQCCCRRSYYRETRIYFICSSYNAYSKSTSLCIDHCTTTRSVSLKYRCCRTGLYVIFIFTYTYERKKRRSCFHRKIWNNHCGVHLSHYHGNKNLNKAVTHTPSVKCIKGIYTSPYVDLVSYHTITLTTTHKIDLYDCHSHSLYSTCFCTQTASAQSIGIPSHALNQIQKRYKLYVCTL